MRKTLSEQLITHQDKLPKYSPPGHAGTVNIRLFEQSFCDRFEMVLGELQPGGEALRHSHDREHQAIYVLSGSAQVTLGDEPPTECGAGAVIKLPPGVDHHVLSVGTEPLRLVMVYSPPLPKRNDTAAD